eukprot:296923-Amphidinium_carterae.4
MIVATVGNVIVNCLLSRTSAALFSRAASGVPIAFRLLLYCCLCVNLRLALASVAGVGCSSVWLTLIIPIRPAKLLHGKCNVSSGSAAIGGLLFPGTVDGLHFSKLYAFKILLKYYAEISKERLIVPLSINSIVLPKNSSDVDLELLSWHIASHDQQVVDIGHEYSFGGCTLTYSAIGVLRKALATAVNCVDSELFHDGYCE